MADLIARQAALAKDAGFQDRAKGAMFATMFAVQGEPQGGLGSNAWQKRQLHAQAVLGNPNAYLDRYAWAAAMDPTVGGQIASPVAISSSTNATPTVVTTGAAHGLAVGDTVEIVGHAGNTNANGTWVVTVVGSATTFTIPAGANAVGTATGSATKQPTDAAVNNALSSTLNDFAGVQIGD
jgi:hypothetical protein